MPEPLLRTRGLEAGYGRNRMILFGVDFDVFPCEVLTLLGANGSGKSTVLNTLSGFLRPTAGSIVLDGKEIAGQPPHVVFRQGVVQVSQKRDLFPDLTVEDNLRLGAAVRGGDRIEATLPQIFEYFPRLAERRSQKVRTMSGGEQQMVAVGRALASQPKILVLDEPSGGLAPHFVNEIGTIFKRLKAAGVTMLMVEQNINLALEVADRFIILRDGLVHDAGQVHNLGAKEDIVKSIYL